MRGLSRVLIGVAAAALLVLSGCAVGNSGSGSEDSTGITARGVGRVTGVPDTLVIVLGVETEAAEAAQALSRNNERAEAVLNRLRAAGIADEDLKTSQFSIFPRFDDEGRSIRGYVVSNLLTARVDADSVDAGELIDQAAAAAGNDIRVQSVGFEIDDEGPLFAEAREDAISKAREQAEQLADAAGVDLGDVRSITEASTVGGPGPSFFALPQTDEASAPILSGTQEITLEVEVVFEID